MEYSEESGETITEMCTASSGDTSSIDTDRVTKDVIKSENALEAVEKSVESSPNSSIITGKKESITNNILDESNSENKYLIMDTCSKAVEDEKGKLLVASEGVVDNRDVASCAMPADEANFLPSTSSEGELEEKSVEINNFMSDEQDDKQPGERPVNLSGCMDDSSSEEEFSEAGTSGCTPTDFCGIQLDSTTDSLKENAKKFVSSEIDVSHDRSLAISSDDEPVIIDARLSEGDSLSFHRGAVVPYSDTEDSDSSSDSSTYESSSDESSESDDSSSQSDTENKSQKAKSKASTGPIKVQGELDIDDLPPIQDLHISVRNDQVVEIGKILHSVDTLVVVEGYKDQPPLDIESVLFLDRGARPLGRIFDVMGPVKEPLYCVRFNSKQHIEEQNIKPDMLVYCAPQTEHSNFVFLQHLLMMKGSDASWKKDKEIPSSCQDFSDDEEEARLKKADNRKKVVNSKSLGEPSPKAARANNQQSSGVHGPGFSEKQGRVFRPRNPWGWPGAQNYNPWNQHHHQLHPPPHLTNSYRPRGHVQPSSFSVESQSHSQPSLRNWTDRFPSNPQFGRQPDSRMFGQPPTSGINAPWPSPETPHPQHPPPPYQGNGYCPRPSMNPLQSQAQYPHNSHQDQSPAQYPHNSHQNQSPAQYPHNSHQNQSPAQYPHNSHQYQSPAQYPHNSHQDQSPAQYPHNSHQDQRYQAFQTEIARLVDAYNRGAESPMAVPPPVRPTGPSTDWISSVYHQNYYPGS
ncbi:H/ACA ribonucleoprotein complex non-core subunit NAF1 [Frankliniella fusca]|uniref:H/ACA ribonucleoprotein complex non-core subunit NAF1 n=1 Tax=Frankliniella fusca TaxID=407009 RepID=A0AAE1LAL7_9NEOP|nr:H/ACA ribonucleoprotein complex non-core subunit NAF1 [Frankliniella fusca]